jgi:hypothetical protein
MDILLFKLSSGETIIAELIHDDEEVYMINNALQVRVEAAKSTLASTLLAHQWLPLLQDENILYVNRQHVIATSAPSDEVTEFYIEAIDKILSPPEEVVEEVEENDYLEKLAHMLRNNNANTTNKSVH